MKTGISMKMRIVWLISVAIGFTACNITEKEEFIHPLSGDISFHASFGDKSPSRTSLQTDGSILWNAHDEIDVFVGEQKFLFTSTNEEPSGEVEFRGKIEDVSWEGVSHYWALYPHREENSFDGQSATVFLPDVQSAVAGGFSDDLFISIARSQNDNLSFYNVCGGVKFMLTEPGVKSVTFQGNNNEVLAGSAKVIFDSDGKPVVSENVTYKSSITLSAGDNSVFQENQWYCIVCYPAVLSAGYTMVLEKEDGTNVQLTRDKAVEVKRSVFGNTRINTGETNPVQINFSMTVPPSDNSVYPALFFQCDGWNGVEIRKEGENANYLAYQLVEAKEDGDNILVIGGKDFLSCMEFDPKTGIPSDDILTVCSVDEGLRFVQYTQDWSNGKYEIKSNTLIEYSELSISRSLSKGQWEQDIADQFYELAKNIESATSLYSRVVPKKFAAIPKFFAKVAAPIMKMEIYSYDPQKQDKIIYQEIQSEGINYLVNLSWNDIKEAWEGWDILKNIRQLAVSEFGLGIPDDYDISEGALLEDKDMFDDYVTYTDHIFDCSQYFKYPLDDEYKVTLELLSLTLHTATVKADYTVLPAGRGHDPEKMGIRYKKKGERDFHNIPKYEFPVTSIIEGLEAGTVYIIEAYINGDLGRFYSASIEVVTSSLAISPQTLTFSKGGGYKTVNVIPTTPDISWVVADYPDWCSITMGDDGISFMVAVDAYDSRRSGQITIAEQEANGNSYYWTVDICQGSSFSVSPENLLFDLKGGTNVVLVTLDETMVEWYIGDSPEWCTIERGNISFWVDVGASDEDRGGIITIVGKYDNGDTEMLSVKVLQRHEQIVFYGTMHKKFQYRFFHRVSEHVTDESKEGEDDLEESAVLEITSDGDTLITCGPLNKWRLSYNSPPAVTPPEKVNLAYIYLYYDYEEPRLLYNSYDLSYDSNSISMSGKGYFWYNEFPEIVDHDEIYYEFFLLIDNINRDNPTLYFREYLREVYNATHSDMNLDVKHEYWKEGILNGDKNSSL